MFHCQISAAATTAETTIVVYHTDNWTIIMHRRMLSCEQNVLNQLITSTQQSDNSPQRQPPRPPQPPKRNKKKQKGRWEMHRPNMPPIVEEGVVVCQQRTRKHHPAGDVNASFVTLSIVDDDIVCMESECDEPVGAVGGGVVPCGGGYFTIDV